MQKHLYILLFALLSFVQANGQGWERIYGGSGQDVAKALAATPDGGYILTGYYNGNARLYLIKVDADGQLQWSQTFMGSLGSSRMEGFGVVNTADNGFAIVGYVDQDGLGPQNRDIYLLKTDAFGNKLWDKSFGGSLTDEGRAIAVQADGCFVITGFQNTANGNENVFILKTDPQGNTLWFNTFGTAQNKKKGVSIAIASNGDFVVAGEQEVTINDDKNAYVLRVGSGGNLIKEQTYGTTAFDIDNNLIIGEDEARDIIATPDGNFVLAGFTNILPGGAGYLIKIDGALSGTPIWEKLVPNNDFNGLALEPLTGNILTTGIRTIDMTVLVDLNILKLDPNGQLIWEAIIGRAGLDGGYAVLPTRGGAIAAGLSEEFISAGGESYAYLVRTDADGKILTSYIQANIFRDFNNNCQLDNGEPGLKNWIVKVESQNQVQYTVANADGDLHVEVDTGVYNLVLFPPNSYWQSCTPTIQVLVPNFYDTVFVAVPVRTVFDCPRNEVDIATPILRRCEDNIYTVRYCNTGSVPSLGTIIKVVLDPMMAYQSSSIPLSSQVGDTLFFAIGTLLNGDCRDFTVTAFLQCDNTVEGTTHCVSALISPNDFCDITSGWDGAIIAAKATCENDTVKMWLANIGQFDMGATLGYVIAEDVIMLTQPNDLNYRFQLPANSGDSLIWTHPANGSTFRIIAEQSPGYPGVSYPTAAVEGCLSDTSTSEISLGFYTMFPEDDADAFKETDCQESHETDFNPNHLKRGHPKGYDVAHHYVSLETDLDFLIQFRNTSADTVRQVIVRDTLSAALDPATVYPGAASHPYQFEMYGNGIVQFTLENINLPPGGGASEGFVKFRVAQKPTLPCETIIFNSAAIYFDFNAPTMSNTTFHTVCEFDSFIIITKTREIYVDGVEVNTFPNPAAESVNFEIKGIEAQQYTLQLYDIQGRLIANLFYHHPTFQLFRHQLPAGEIIYRLAADGKPVASGKLIVR
ncbi:MAG: T9SS type A sorting domain-containing protein [Saprospiraceae bacterium]|nr:T9SS type A sorting domain-containing protein [Saprospiraceae bacterium]